jgi:hypothetical protein
MSKTTAAVLLLVFAAAIPEAAADTEAVNQPQVTAGPYGECYVKSVPSGDWGQGGVTRLYRVTAQDDELVATYDWYSQQIHVRCHAMRNGVAGVSVVRLGPWARGHEASSEDLALALYFDGEFLASYSNLDIAGTPDNVDASVSHYMVFEEVVGFRYGEADRYEFSIRASDGRILAFDTATGERRDVKP